MVETDRPKVGIGVIVFNNGKILLGMRKNSHGNHTWNFPGGHLEFNEEIIDCAKREVLEETGLKIQNPTIIGQVTNDIFIEEKKHYITIFVMGTSDNSEPKIMEPEKCDGWSWFDWEDLPQPLFLPIQNLIKQGFVPTPPIHS